MQPSTHKHNTLPQRHTHTHSFSLPLSLSLCWSSQHQQHKRRTRHPRERELVVAEAQLGVVLAQQQRLQLGRVVLLRLRVRNAVSAATTAAARRRAHHDVAPRDDDEADLGVGARRRTEARRDVRQPAERVARKVLQPQHPFCRDAAGLSESPALSPLLLLGGASCCVIEMGLVRWRQGAAKRGAARLARGARRAARGAFLHARASAARSPCSSSGCVKRRGRTSTCSPLLCASRPRHTRPPFSLGQSAVLLVAPKKQLLSQAFLERLKLSFSPMTDNSYI